MARRGLRCGAWFRRIPMKKFFAILALSTTLLAATACNTVRGAGRDAQSAANAVDNAM
jgi:predicted small secreted protein